MGMLLIIFGVIALGSIAVYFLGGQRPSYHEMRSRTGNPQAGMDVREEMFERFADEQRREAEIKEREDEQKEKKQEEKKYDVEL